MWESALILGGNLLYIADKTALVECNINGIARKELKGNTEIVGNEEVGNCFTFHLLIFVCTMQRKTLYRISRFTGYIIEILDT